MLAVIVTVVLLALFGVFASDDDAEDPMTIAECRRRGGTAVVNVDGDLDECHIPPRPR